MTRKNLVTVGLVLLALTFLAALAGQEEEKVFFFSSGGAWLGVNIADIDGARAKELGLKEERGADVQTVVPGSPAAEAGIKEGDVILEYQGTKIEGVAQLTRLVRETPAGRGGRPPGRAGHPRPRGEGRGGAREEERREG